MKRTTSMTIAAIVVATIATSAAMPAFAQDAGRDPNGPGRDMQMRGPGQDGFWKHDRRGSPDGMRMALREGPGNGGRGGILDLVCAPQGADRLEHMLLSIAQRVDPTAEQQPLYDTFKAAALTAQTDFADACTAARPDQTADATAAKPDLADRLKVRLDIEKAHVEAMTAVIPTFEAFYDSLSDEQKQNLEPRRQGFRMLDEHRGPDHGRPNMDQPQDS